MKILVTGGAGYIGSFMVRRLLDDGHDVVVADDFERGSRKAIDKRAIIQEGNLLDEEFVTKLFSETQFDAVMHFAAFIAVSESVENPGLYFRNNLVTTLNLLDQMKDHGSKHFIFSSTGTVYGTPKTEKIAETHPTNPENPYAETKLMVEKMLHWYSERYHIGYAVLRYFNAAGAALDGSMGENHSVETHLIPNAINAALKGTEFSLFGEDYDTPDKTAIRDYIHVLDLIEAHILTLKKLGEENGEYIYNVGTGHGSSNKEVIEMVKEISGKDLSIVIKPRRPGDVGVTVADPTKIMHELHFQPKYSDLRTIIESALKWHKKLLEIS